MAHKKAFFMLRAKIPQENLEPCLRTYCSEERLLILADLALEYATDIRISIAMNRVAERIEARPATILM